MADRPFDRLLPGQRPSFDELVEQVRVLTEDHGVLKLKDLPVAELKSNLEQNWQPDASLLLNPQSIKPELLVAVPHVAVVRIITAQTIANATPTLIAFDTAVDSNPEMWKVGTPTTVVLPRAGVYQLNGEVVYQVAAGGARQAGLFVGAGEITRGEVGSAGGAAFTSAIVSACHRFAAGAQITMNAYQDSGAPLNTVRASLDVTWVSN